MGEISFLILLFAIAAIVLVAEVFIPSHGVLTVVGLGFLVVAIVKTFAYGQVAGVLAIIATLIVLPVFAVTAVKVWPHTRIGRILSPLNPVSTKEQKLADLEDIVALVGRQGRTLSPMRPVGACEFDGRRLECICESGMIDAGVVVRAVGIKGRNLEVAVADSEEKPTTES